MTLNSPYTGQPMRTIYEPDTWEMRGESYNYVRTIFVDEPSGDRFTSTQSDTAAFEQVANQYRKRHGIPYADEIIGLRHLYGLSAAKMSEVLGFGTNQWRLYEAGEVPSESNGKMIRSAMNPSVMMDLVQASREQFAERDYVRLTEKIAHAMDEQRARQKERDDVARLYACERGEWNGYAPLSTARLRGLLLYVLGQFGEAFKTQMNKLLFYIDFLAYRERGMAISGLAYKAIDFGPVPQRYERVYSEFDEVEQLPRLVANYEGTVLAAAAEADGNLFSEQERAIVDAVCEHFKGWSARRMSEVSHGEPIWQQYVAEHGQLPFCEAYTLVAM